MIPVYIGYDAEVEPVAYHVCADSIIRRSSLPLRITPLALHNFKSFYTERHQDGSNAFVYSRFLIPYLEGWTGFAIFLDGDMVVRDDIAKLWALRDPYKAVQVVRHAYRTKHPVKYRGAPNADYVCKNWSSVVLWNCGSYINRCLKPEFVEHQTGSFLHRFSWVPPDRLGDLPDTWNRLVLEQEIRAEDHLLHYTIGTPCFADYAARDGADEWHRAKALAFSHKEA